MEDAFVVLVTLDGRNQFNRILEGEGAAKATAERYAKDILNLQEKGDRGCWEVFLSKVIDRQSFAYGGPNLMLNAPQGGRMLVGSDGSSSEQSWRRLLRARKNALDNGSALSPETCCRQ
jgi:hypothetical protein